MRGVLAALLVVFTAPVLAAGIWRPYENSRLGYALDLPASFTIEVVSDDHLLLKEGTTTLELFGLDTGALSFDDAVALSVRSTVDEGFAMSGQRIAPDWARYEAEQGERRLAVGLIALCGHALAGYELRYMQADGPVLIPVVKQLDGSLRRTGKC